MFKRRRIDDIFCIFSQTGSCCQCKALMAGSPYAHSLMPCPQILHIRIHLFPQVYVALQQVFCFHLWTFAHDQGKSIPVDHRSFYYIKSASLHQGSQCIKGIIRNMVTDQFIITAVLHNVLKTWHCNKSHGIIFQIIPDSTQHSHRIRLMFQEIKG